MAATDVVPFTVHVSDDDLDDLRSRLARTRLTDEIPGLGWDYGMPLDYYRELIGYWRDGFDWRAAEARINAYEHFRTEIKGRQLHFMQARSPEADALPLIVTHGWPGSFVEFLTVADQLANPRKYGADPADAFHVICPSMPGYGFSDAAMEPGCDVKAIAEGNIELAARLGFDRYGVQGGDWGAMVSVWSAFLDPSHCVGLHLNLVRAMKPAGEEPPLTAVEERRRDAARRFSAFERGYQEIQRTRPQTLGYALNDSPAGLAAWICEKYYDWTDRGGEERPPLSMDDMLTNVMIYWITNTATSAARLYLETHRSNNYGPSTRVDVPTAGAIFPNEVIIPRKHWAEAAFNLQRWTEYPKGGHFAAMEVPDSLVTDVREFFRTVR
ncbi:MAG: epoxide hydrolase family protein [Acidimicrobiia bacterium]